jgi:hypothetical protein
MFKMLRNLFDLEHLLTPIAVEHECDKFRGEVTRSYRLLYIFGFRVAFWSTTKFSK